MGATSGIVSSCIRLVVFCGTEALKDNTCMCTHSPPCASTAPLLIRPFSPGASVSLVSWSVIEPGMYLAAACLPALRPICSKIVPQSLLSRFSGYSSRSGKHSIPLDDVPPASYSGFAKLKTPDDEESRLYHPGVLTQLGRGLGDVEKGRRAEEIGPEGTHGKGVSDGE